MNSKSTLDPDNLPARPQRKTPQGHDTRALGPSDSSDTGADMAGPGLLDDDVLGLDRGTNEDSEAGHGYDDAGASVGDIGLDDTSDSGGTGERMTAGKEQHVRAGADIAPDRIVGPGDAGLGGGLDEAEEARAGVSDATRHAGAGGEQGEGAGGAPKRANVSAKPRRSRARTKPRE